MVAAKIQTPVEARNFLKALRGLMKHAVKMEMRTDDPTVGVTRPKVRSPGIHTWDEEEIATFEAKHAVGTKARLAFALLLFTAQRRGDVIRMGKQHVRGGFVHIKQRKTSVELKIPIHPDLAKIISASPSDQLTFLTTHSGAPFSDAGFGNVFREWCREAGLPARCSAHGLRKAACRRLAEAGASAIVIASITGHRTLRMVEGYTRAADQAHMAQAGMNLISGVEKRTIIGKP
jgi:integrase